MHFSHVVMLPGGLPPEALREHVEAAMSRYSEHDEDAVSGEWDWFSVGGRWGYAWVLREGGENGPLSTDGHSFGMNDDPGKEDGRVHTDCARLSELEYESLTAPYSWLTPDGVWHTRWLGPEGSGSDDVKDWEVSAEEVEKQWLATIKALPSSTWMVHVDCHT